MARKAKKSSEKTTAQVAAPVPEQTPARKPDLIVCKRSYDRWYVYFKGISPKNGGNVGCGCKTAKSAMRYMHLLKSRHGATISQNCYDRLQFEAQREG